MCIDCYEIGLHECVCNDKKSINYTLTANGENVIISKKDFIDLVATTSSSMEEWGDMEEASELWKIVKELRN